MADETTDVLVVGAGPTGLMLANCLTRLGVDVVIIDGKPGPTRESRALGVQARTMELYDQLGFIDRVLDRSTPALGIVPGYRSAPFGVVRLPDIGATVSPYPRVHVVEQSANEELLVENLERLGGAVRWNTPLLGMERVEGDRPVRAVLEGGGVRARYCVGADGTSSLVRKLRGIPFEGETNPYTFYVLDGVGVAGLVPGYINFRMSALDFLLTFPMGNSGEARLLGIVRNLAPAEQVEQGRVRRRLSEVFSVTYQGARWFSAYRVHHRVAARFRDGPVFLAGDAAHVHSPVGAQGMNTGIQDAHNLASKLADVLSGRAADPYLDRYEAERRPVARRLVTTTDRLFGAITSGHPLAAFVRSRVVPVLGPIFVRTVPRLPFGRRLFSYVSQTRIHYWMSESAERAAHGHRGRIVGRRLKWSGGNFDSLRSFSWQVHAYSPRLRSAAEATAGRLGLAAQVFDSPGFSVLRRDRLYLVRPDGFVAAEGSPARALLEFAAVFTRMRAERVRR
jgi:2-polyprenyl-6-methoxyphenol hydroxylase-like FAD-dependent oxidoreductase